MPSATNSNWTLYDDWLQSSPLGETLGYQGMRTAIPRKSIDTVYLYCTVSNFICLDLKVHWFERLRHHIFPMYPVLVSLSTSSWYCSTHQTSVCSGCCCCNSSVLQLRDSTSPYQCPSATLSSDLASLQFIATAPVLFLFRTIIQRNMKCVSSCCLWTNVAN